MSIFSGWGQTAGQEFRSRNFSIYGQWAGILAMIVCLATGISGLFNIFKPLTIIFAILAIVSGALIIFIEIPLLLKICPTSPKFDEFIKKFHSNYGRALIYFCMSIAQWLSLIVHGTALIAAAIFLLFPAIFYGLAGLKKQEFATSKTLGGGPVASYIV
ncbi:hypothetical protein BJ508DRAFT_6353 [Ascobolus immersus RN42]|uniref:Golgi apparatus membrane protein TVP18 n=1 Tax=Ascobolus immersus RN42 TaxID=1160509 RepID=A0A3N4IGL4_ASCIM|nr:hypothetical protein BJ508DRAFT_6353 [Ascobolus immersus RN42]